MHDYQEIVDNFFNDDDKFLKYSKVKTNLMYGSVDKSVELSIIMPVYKRVSFIRNALDSVLNQKTNIKYNVIIVDNTVENDSIFNIVKEYPRDRVAYFKNEINIGMFGNWNRCIELAPTPYVTMLHDDDMLKDDYVENVMQLCKKYPEINCLGVLHDEIDENGDITVSNNDSNQLINVKPKEFYINLNKIHICGCLIKKQVAMKIGGFNENTSAAADTNFLCKIACHVGGAYQYNKTLSSYRVAENESMKDNVLYECVNYTAAHMDSLYKEYMSKDVNYTIASIHRNICILGMEIAIHEKFNSGLDFRELNSKLNVKNINIVERMAHKIWRKIYAR